MLAAADLLWPAPDLTAADILFGAWEAWNADLHPRGPGGKFAKLGDAEREARRAARNEARRTARAEAKKAVKAATQAVRVPRGETAFGHTQQRQAHIEHARSVAKMAADIEELGHNLRDEHNAEAIGVMTERARTHAAMHDLHPIGSAGAVVPFHPEHHHAIGARPPAGHLVEVVRPGYRWQPGEAFPSHRGETVVLEKAHIVEHEPAVSAKPTPVPEPHAGRSVEERIHAAYGDVVGGRHGEWASLADIREHPALAGVPRSEVDAALRRIEQHPDANIVPESNQKSLTDRQRAAAVVIGDQHKHAMTIMAEPIVPASHDLMIERARAMYGTRRPGESDAAWAKRVGARVADIRKLEGTPAVAKAIPDVSHHAAHIEAVRTRVSAGDTNAAAEVKTYLAGIKGAQLNALAKHYRAYGRSATDKRNAIYQMTVGFLADSIAIRRL